MWLFHFFWRWWRLRSHFLPLCLFDVPHQHKPPRWCACLPSLWYKAPSQVAMAVAMVAIATGALPSPLKKSHLRHR